MRRLWRWRAVCACTLAVVTLGVLACACVLLTLAEREDISCHYASDKSETSAFTSPAGPAIFFHETACDTRQALNARQACAVESAARAHPSHSISVLFLSPESAARADALRSGTADSTLRASEAPLAALLLYDNVRTVRVQLHNYAAGSPLEEWLATAALNESRYRVAHTSDVLRYLTLWKFGGIYLDLDVVVAKPLGELAANWAGRESQHAIAAGALSFSRDADGRRYADVAIRELRASFSGYDWGNNGPGVITRILRRHCGTDRVTLMTSHRCSGFEVYPEEYFYPIPWSEWARYMEPTETERVRNMTNTYIFHMWNKHSAGRRVRKSERVPYVELAERFCPRVLAAVDYL